MESAFGVEHGHISKSGPWAGAHWTPKATEQDKAKHGRRKAAAFGTILTGGGLAGATGLKGKTGKAGLGLGAAGVVGGVHNNLSARKKGLAVTEADRRKQR